MLSTVEILVLFGLVALAGYWFAALRNKELARAAGQRTCEQANVQFLDDTVELRKLRLRRGESGGLVLYREYRFEFTNDGAHRCRGEITMLGPRVLRLTLEPFRI
jgi:hypothetical protein